MHSMPLSAGPLVMPWPWPLTQTLTRLYLSQNASMLKLGEIQLDTFKKLHSQGQEVHFPARWTHDLELWPFDSKTWSTLPLPTRTHAESLVKISPIFFKILCEQRLGHQRTAQIHTVTWPVALCWWRHNNGSEIQGRTNKALKCIKITHRNCHNTHTHFT